MPGLLTAFLFSFFSTLLIIRFKHLHVQFSGDHNLYGPQKFHKNIVPRVGGISIAIGIFSAVILRYKNIPTSVIELTLLICVIPTFSIGLTEDLTKKISVKLRLIFTAITAALFIHLIPAQISRLDIPFIDLILDNKFLGAGITIFAITGLANAYNIIDGFNGLASMVAMIALMAIAYVGFIVSDSLLVHLSLIMAAAILGFFVWNYPRGLIFLGDGGAYLIGTWIAFLSVLLIDRNEQISPWFVFLINIYPINETLFTIYRRKIHQGRNPGQPDGIHFHTLIYRRVLKVQETNQAWISTNSKTSPYLWVMTLGSVAPAMLWWNSTLILLAASAMFILIYIWLYWRIVKFKTPKLLNSSWLI